MTRALPLAQYRRALRYLIPYWPRLAGVLLAGFFATGFGLAQPYISKLLIDEALLGHNLRALLAVSGLMVAATVLSFVLNILSSYQYVRISAAVLFDMRLALYRHLQTLSPRFWAGTKLGDVVSRVNSDISEVQRVSADSLLGLLTNIAFLIGSAAIMASMNARLFLFSLAALPPSIWALRHFQGRLADRVRVVRERSADIGSFLLETLLGIRVVATTGAVGREVERFRIRNERFVDAMLKMQIMSLLAGAVPATIITLCTAALFLYGGKLVIDGAITTGSLVAMMAYHARLLAPVQNLMGMYSTLVAGGVSLARVWELFDTHAEIQEAPDAVPLLEAKGTLELDQVSFSYGQRPVLDRLSLRIPAGSICAVLGPSGAGKSTLADLLVRFYDPQAGTIRLDGHDLRDLRLADLRRHVMLLDQAPYLFHTSVRENITYAAPGATDEEIHAAARAAAIHDRILSLPQGYDTVLAERGQTLSAGERQRVALARALLANPAVLVLDEPTSALDADSEQTIIQALSTALAGRTAIIITHRPALARIADQVLMLGGAASQSNTAA